MNKKSFLKVAAIFTTLSIIAISCAKEEGDDNVVTLARDKFIGTWHMNSHGTLSGSQTWDLIIEPATAFGTEQVIMKNFDLTGNDKTVYATVNGSNLEIPGTVVGAVTVEGTGNLSNNILTLDYTSTDSQTDSVHATGSK